MSDLLIKGMEMPEDGRYTLCITHDSNGKVHWVFQNQDTLKFLKHRTIIEVPPHGRLIDANALPVSTAVPFDHVSYEYVSLYNIRNAPTIIEAEEAK